MVAEVQKRGGIAGFIDAEHALDPVYAKNIGVDIDNLYRLYTVSMKKQRIIFLLLWKNRDQGARITFGKYIRKKFVFQKII